MSCTCPYCNKPAELVTGTAIYPHRPDLSSLRFWRCEPCGAYVGCHKKGAYFYVGAAKVVSDGTLPLGCLANAELRSWKSKAHAAFDPLWKTNGLGRSAAYAWLANKMGLHKSACHIGEFTVEQCKEVVRLCDLATGKTEAEKSLDAMCEARWGKAA